MRYLRTLSIVCRWLVVGYSITLLLLYTIYPDISNNFVSKFSKPYQPLITFTIIGVGLNAARSGPYREEVRSKTRAIPADGGNVPALLKGSV
jgi:hypothetical protein